MKTKLLITCLTAATALFLAWPAAGYHLCYCLGSRIAWASDNITFRTSAVSFPSGSGFRDALDDAVDAWNDNPSRFSFTLQHGDSSVGVGNLQNEAWFSSSEFWLSGGSAITVQWSYCANWAEADIICDADRDYYWFTSNDAELGWAYGGAYRPFHGTALHELGHVLGLDHECGTFNIMGENWNNCNRNGDTQHFYPGEDACNGAVALYDLDSQHREDVSVVHWKWVGCDGEYSEHDRCTVYRLDGVEVDRLSGTSDDPIFKVSKGHNILLEFTLENNGATTQSPRVGFYLSSNKTITTWGDDLLETRRPTIKRNTVYTTTQQITIPTDLSSDSTYYLGIIVDDEGAISEVNESNNATYVGIYIK